MTQASPNLVNVLRLTLEHLERSEELATDDPALAELKGSLLSNITELEVAKTPKAPGEAPGPRRILWISRRACADVQEAIKPDQASSPSGQESTPPERPADKA